MPVGTPFHDRVRELCVSYRWKDWSGCYSVCSFETCHLREYHALRHACGLIDVSPLFKYEVVGDDAAEYLARVLTRDVRPLKRGRVAYSCWCDDEGKVIDDGTVAHLDRGRWFLTAADACFDWLCEHSRGYKVEILDVRDEIAALALQGPSSREVLAACSGADLGGLGFFGTTEATIGQTPVRVSRTGYTGDLGYEIWVKREHAVGVWDALLETGRPHGLMPAGLEALDLARIEAGFVMAGVDYQSARHCSIESRKSTPYELDLGWTVHLKREPFIGQRALLAEKERGPEFAFVGLEIDWDELESLYGAQDLPPTLPTTAWRTSVPIYDSYGEEQVGYATSGAFSPLLKRNLALATVTSTHCPVGTKLQIEQTVEHTRHKVTATVAHKPFFDPARKRT